MKIKGKEIKSAYEKEVILRRGKRDADIVFTVRAVLDFDDFEKMVPVPTPPTKLVRDQGKVKDFESPVYKAQVMLRNQQRTAWMFIHSLLATEGLEFDIVKLDDPSTWLRYPEEFRAAGLSAGEVNRVMQAILEVNGLAEDKVEEERRSFSPAEEAEDQKSSSNASEPTAMQSGGPAND